MTTPGQPNPAEGWKAVSPAPSVGPTAPMPGWVKPAIAGGIAALLLAGGVVGGMLGANSRTADQPLGNDPSPSPTESEPAFEMEPPRVVGELVRGQVTESTGPAPANQRIVQADYTDGEQTLILVLTWPEPDVANFLTGAAIEAAAETAPGTDLYCGVSEDTGESACGEVVEDVGMLLASISPQGEEDVAATLELFQEEMGL